MLSRHNELNRFCLKNLMYTGRDSDQLTEKKLTLIENREMV